MDWPEETVRSTLWACALTHRRWRHRAQSLLHRKVTLSSSDFQEIAALYTPDPSHPSSVYAADLSRYPRVLSLDEYSPHLFHDAYRELGDWYQSQAVQTFIARCDRLESLRISSLQFAHFDAFLAFIAPFRRIVELELYSVVWGTSTWHQNDGVTSRGHGSGASPHHTNISHLRRFVDYTFQDHPQLNNMIDWIIAAQPTPGTLEDVYCDCLSAEGTEKASKLLTALGASLRYLSLTCITSEGIRKWHGRR